MGKLTFGDYKLTDLYKKNTLKRRFVEDGQLEK